MAERAVEESTVFHSSKPGRKRKKRARGVKEGKTIREIADKRDLAASTIEAHVVKGISEGQLDIGDVLPKQIVDEVSRLMKETPGSISQTHKTQSGNHSFGVLRMVEAHLHRKASSDHHNDF